MPVVVEPTVVGPPTVAVPVPVANVQTAATAAEHDRKREDPLALASFGHPALLDNGIHLVRVNRGAVFNCLAELMALHALAALLTLFEMVEDHSHTIPIKAIGAFFDGNPASA